MDNIYLSLKYNSKARWLSYWYQISEALEVSPENVLVIGKGSGIAEGSLKLLAGEKVKVVTLDINPSVKPDIVGSVTNIPFKDNSFDVIICCQVLEHLPFEQFQTALSEMQRIVRKRVVISVPHGRKFIRLSFNTPLSGEKDIIIKNPFTKKTITSRQHYWEIGRGVSRRQVIEQIKRHFNLEKEFLNEINCTHRFFILGKKQR